MAATLMGTRRDIKGIDALLLALGDEDENVRAAVAEALGNLGDDSAVMSLMRLFEDESQQVRDVALWSLRRLVPERLAEGG